MTKKTTMRLGPAPCVPTSCHKCKGEKFVIHHAQKYPDHLFLLHPERRLYQCIACKYVQAGTAKEEK